MVSGSCTAWDPFLFFIECTALVLVVNSCFNKYSIYGETSQTTDDTMHWMWYGTVFGIHFYKQYPAFGFLMH